MQSKSTKNIYWERQGADKLCGVHCINSLLQGPYFSEIDLAQIAQEIDAKEQELFSGQGNQKEYLNYFKDGSNNVAEDGNFSIQVLTEALKKTANLIVQSVDAKINQGQDLSNETGFICNSAAHWFTIRKVDQIWYNLNSTNKRGPEIISDFYLSAFLQSIKENGYTIFVIRGDYPNHDQNMFQELNQNQHWFTQFQIEKIQEIRKKKKSFKLNIGGTDERDMEVAMKRSLGKKDVFKIYQKRVYQVSSSSDDEDYREAFEPENEQKPKPRPMFTGQGVSIEGKSGVVNYSKFEMNASDDPELNFAVRMSMSEKFDKMPASGLTVGFLMPDGSQQQWIFNEFSSVEVITDLYDFVFFNQKEGECYKFVLNLMYPRKQLSNLGLSLSEVGVDDMTQIIVTKQ